MRRHKILVVDDEVPNLRLLRRVLSADHDIIEAQSGAEALEILKAEEISLIITDQRMPAMTGVQLLEQSLSIRPDAIKILLTGYTDVQALIDAINAGHVYKYIPKPWDAEELKLTVRRALENYELKESHDQLVVALRNALLDLEAVSVGTIRALADALDAKCDYTAGHSVRVSRISVLIGRELGLSDELLRDIELGGILHDIGKIGVPESILWKAEALTPEEREIMSKHPVTSAEIIGDLKGLLRAREYVRHHHEHYNGQGYPSGLSGKEIPIGASIILVSDAYDAMTTDRPYRKAIGHQKAIEELSKQSGNQFDPEIVDALMRVLEKAGHEIDKLIQEEFSQGFIGLNLPSVDPAKTGKRYLEEVERRGRL
ncbi:MAG: response regulator [Candidatus Melainabacteria bacterium]|jgi:putative two-component system response regulator|nr:response regulator [Candidatus Melainabacteria bacterium]MBX9672561.1 response regulator [Candidatus Obscuribacterales bacterium]